MPTKAETGPATNNAWDLACWPGFSAGVSRLTCSSSGLRFSSSAFGWPASRVFTFLFFRLAPQLLFQSPEPVRPDLLSVLCSLPLFLGSRVLGFLVLLARLRRLFSHMRGK